MHGFDPNDRSGYGVACRPGSSRRQKHGPTPIGHASAEFKPFVAAQVKIIAEIVRSAGIAPD
jgi:hypothetical protein